MHGSEFSPVPVAAVAKGTGIGMHHLEMPLTTTEAGRRKDLLGQLKDALADRHIASALAGRRTLVLRSAQDGAGRGGYREPVRMADPELYIFAADGIRIVRTDGEFYWLAGAYPHPVADPVGAAQLYARFWGGP